MTSDSSDLHRVIDLAHEPGFTLGGIRVRPGLRQLVRDSDGAEEMVEPRVMQVLVALARAKGAIVTRDELIRDCWEGRVVGEDAINRALSRVRRLSEGIAAGADDEAAAGPEHGSWPGSPPGGMMCRLKWRRSCSRR